MTAREVLNNAVVRLGYLEDQNPELYKNILNRAVAVINDVYSDLYSIVSADEFEPIKTLADTIKLPQKAMGALIYGVAAFFALSQNDSDSQNFFMSVYNQKRASLSKIVTKKDVLLK